MTAPSAPSGDQSRSGSVASLFGRATSATAFWWWFVLILVVSSASAYFGSKLGSDLATMGQLLGGTLGVAVAFAGAYAAYKIATFANDTLKLQERREAFRTANETLEKSIGEILNVQLHFESLLRLAVELNGIKNAQTDSGATRAAEMYDRQIAALEERVQEHAEKLSQSIKDILTNPLALSVLFALHDKRCQSTGGGKEADGGEHRSRDHRAIMLEDLSQLPRFLDHLCHLVRTRGYKGDYRECWYSPYDLALRMKEACDVGSDGRTLYPPDLVLDLQDLIYGEALETLQKLSLLCHLTAEFSGSPTYEVNEPSLIRVLRYFIYSPTEADAALGATFPETVYHDADARKSILEGGAASAFRGSGRINDYVVTQLLRDSRLLTDRLKGVLGRSDAMQPAILAAFKALAVHEFGRKTAVARSVDEIYAEQLEREEDRESALEKLVWQFTMRYQSDVCRALFLDLLPEWSGISTFEIYQIILEHYFELRPQINREEEAAKRKLACLAGKQPESTRETDSDGPAGPDEDKAAKSSSGIIQLFSRVSRSHDFLRARNDMLRRLRQALPPDLLCVETPDTLRAEVAKLCDLAEEADALNDLARISPTRAARGPNELTASTTARPTWSDLDSLFSDLKEQLHEQIIRNAFASATEEEKQRMIASAKTRRVWPKAVKIAALACEKEKSPDEFERWLERPHVETLGQNMDFSATFIACELRSLGFVVSIDQVTEEFFRIGCAEIPGVPAALARQVHFHYDTTKGLTMAFRIAGEASGDAGHSAGDWSRFDVEEEIRWLALMLGYGDDGPRGFIKQLDGRLTASLRWAVLELRVIGLKLVPKDKRGAGPVKYL